MVPLPGSQQFSIIPTKESKLVEWGEKALLPLSFPLQAHASRGSLPHLRTTVFAPPEDHAGLVPSHFSILSSRSTPGHAGAGHEGVLLYSSKDKNDNQKGRK